MKTLRQKRINKQGFSLLEILASLFVLGTSLSVIFSGFEVSKRINNEAAFESEAAFLAERELELAKSELLNGSIKTGQPQKLKSRFRLKPGWKMFTLLTEPDKDDVVRLQVRVTQSNRELQLESFLFLPSQGVKNES